MADSFSIDDVVKRYSDVAGKIDQYFIQEVPYFEGTVKKLGVALVDKGSSSISMFASDVKDLQDGLDKLFHAAGSIVLDAAAPTLAKDGDTTAVHPENQTVPSVVGPGYGVDGTTTNSASKLGDLNNQPESKVVVPTAQEGLSGSTVDVSDVTPAAGQSTADAVSEALPEGATPVVLNSAGASAEDGNKAVDASK